MKCDACGSESDFDAGFIKQPEALGGPAKNFCAVCWVKRSNLRRAWFLPMLMVAAAFGYAEDKVALYGSESGRLLMNIAVIGLFTVLTIIPHELGHAMMGRAVGWRVQQVVIGVGKSLFKRRWVGIL